MSWSHTLPCPGMSRRTVGLVPAPASLSRRASETNRASVATNKRLLQSRVEGEARASRAQRVMFAAQ